MKADSGEIPGRLRWLCRRGMLELDAWLQPFLEQHYPALDAESQAAFRHLLELDDMQLYHLLTGADQPPPPLRGIIDQLSGSRP